MDRVVDTVSAALARNGHSAKAVERWNVEMPREEEMLPKDKYTIFDKKEKRYRKSIHSTSSLRSCWSAVAEVFSDDTDRSFFLQSFPSGLVSANV